MRDLIKYEGLSEEFFPKNRCWNFNSNEIPMDPTKTEENQELRSTKDANKSMQISRSYWLLSEIY